MLDDVTKKRINTLRQILVGKLPDPKAQVEQITNALIYKFMNDMDEESVSMGGKATYFSGSFQKYSWKNLMNSQTSGVEKLSLYADALNKMSDNENLPTLFRDIFKDSVLPFKDPATLNMFLKEINEFHYSNSEKLGDAFEYLLSFMGSQGDAGQFRTPRHIIDFIVKIVNPQKNEAVLDPACGTAGFLISSYKHILKQNTKKNLGDCLNASDRKKIGENLNGYDISPDMVKMSLVNMYLHKFTNPKINEYDSLSSEDRWNEYYDVILANPPFFSPKGGITPHNRFGVKSTKAEVLFVDYINEHLKPNGRAGIIVPEGVIFQTGTAYKQLRKKLIETSLIGVISMPAGIFNPYAGVKTAILILDKSKKSDVIFFADVKNDGFSLTTNRTQIEKNDLPIFIKEFYSKDTKKNKLIFEVTKDKIISNDYVLSLNQYKSVKEINSKFELQKLDDLFIEIKNGKNVSQSDNGLFRVSRIESISKAVFDLNKTKWTSDNVKDEDFLKYQDILFSHINSIVHIGKTAIYELNEKVIHGSNLLRFRANSKLILPKYALYIFKNKIFINLVKQFTNQAVNQASVNTKSLKSIQIPVPSLDFQNKVVGELDNYQKIIDGCKHVLENYKPFVDIDPNWKMIELEDEIDFISGVTLQVNKSKDKNGIPIITMADMTEDGYIDTSNIRKVNPDGKKYHTLKKGDLLFNWRNGSTHLVGKTAYFDLDGEYIFASFSQGIRTKKNILSKYLWVILNQYRRDGIYMDYMRQSINGIFNREEIKKLKVPIPSLDIQQKIIDETDEQIKLLKNNHRLIKIFEEKIDNKINSTWSK
jgi:type I restriction enzyme M protein